MRTLCDDTTRGPRTEGGIACPSSGQPLRARQNVQRAKATLPETYYLRARSVPLCTRGLYTQRLKIGLRLITPFIVHQWQCQKHSFLRKEIALLPIPEWALEIVEAECALSNREEPKLRWIKKRANGFVTVGKYTRYQNGVIRVSVGRDNQEKQVLLHELSHHLITEGIHGRTFYLMLRGLLLKYDCLTEDYKKRENKYRKISIGYL
jgi:hypothetical protein